MIKMVVNSEDINSDICAKPIGPLNEISLAKVLAGNEKRSRDRALKFLSKWLTRRCSGQNAFTEKEIMTIWTGLYYSMWMSDKPLIQEDLAESLSRLVHCFSSNDESALLFIKCFYVTMMRSWAGLDQHRMDKFGMLLRRFLRQSLEYLANKQWNTSLVKKMMSLFRDSILLSNEALGLKLHFIDIFLEELAKVGREHLKIVSLTKILTPFIRLIVTTEDPRVRKQLDSFFCHLIRQTDVAIEFEEKFRAWKRARFPGGDISCVVIDDSVEEEDENGKPIDEEMVEGEEEKEEMEHLAEKAMDPRAGNIHVDLPQITVPCGIIVNILRKHLAHPESTLKGRRLGKIMIKRFRTLKRGKCPLGMKKVPTAHAKGRVNKRRIEKCAKKLIKDSSFNKHQRKIIRQKIKRLNALLEKERNFDNMEGEQHIEDLAEKVNRKAAKKLEKFQKSDDIVGENDSEGSLDSLENEMSELELSPCKGNEKLADGNKLKLKSKKKMKKLKKAQIDHVNQESKESVRSPKKQKKDSVPKSQIPSPIETPKESNEEDTLDILKSVNLVRNSKKKEIINKENGECPGNFLDIGKKDKPDKDSSIVINCDVQPGSSDGKEKRTTELTLKKRKLGDYECTDIVEGEATINKKRRTSTGWIVDKFKQDAVLSPQTVITLERKKPFVWEMGKEDPWAMPLQEGETEIVVPNRKYSGVPKTPVFWERVLQKVSPKTPSLPTPVKAIETPTTGRRISFNLALNREQNKHEYLEEVQRSPVPYDKTKTPKRSSLKSGLAPSPINPFYRRKKL